MGLKNRLLDIRLGAGLDGSSALPMPTSLGAINLGPQGLLGLLELHLGLTGDWPMDSLRTTAYVSALHQCVAPGVFYRRSLESDSLGVAAHLIRLRDQLFLDGWDGSRSPGFGDRLMALADVESLFDERMKCSIGERLQRVAAKLETRNVPIGKVSVIDPPELYPLAWRRVLGRLPVYWTQMSNGSSPDTMLGELQQKITRMLDGEAPRTLSWRDDGSLHLPVSETALLSARWVAARLVVGSEDCVLLGDAAGERLDHALEQADKPRHGFAERNDLRPALQLLPMVLALTWDPLDIGILLQFLSHRMCPIPRRARRLLADRVAQAPGLRSEHYADQFRKIREEFADNAEEILEDIELWLFPERYSPSEGAPLEAIVPRVDSLRKRLLIRKHAAGEESDPVSNPAVSQCEAVSAGLKFLLASGQTHIGPQQIRKLVSQASVGSGAHPLRVSEAGSGRCAVSPAEVIDPADEVIWWNMDAPRSSRRSPWSRAERSQLQAAGVEMPSEADRLKAEFRVLFRPVLAARRSLVLVDKARREETHPVLQIIRMLIPDAPTMGLEDTLSDPAGITSMRKIRHVPLPSPRRWWNFREKELPSLMESASFTSLEQYINNPAQWLLNYVARLDSSLIHSVPDEFTLSGSVAHRVIERLYQRKDALRMSEKQVSEMVEEALDEVLRSEAAVFFLPGWQSSRRTLQQAVDRSVIELHRHLRRANASAVRAEHWMEGKFTGGAIRGGADLVVELGDAGSAIIDLKWAGMKKYPDKLAANRHLQLVIYSGLFRQSEGSWPTSAYYLLKDAQLLAQDREVFSEARKCGPVSRFTAPQLWSRFERTWAWRRAQLDQGRVEVVIEAIEADESSSGPDDGLEPETLSTAYNPFTHLLGWNS